MNLDDLRSELRLQIGSPSTDSVSEQRLDKVINEAYQHLLDRYPHSVSRAWLQFTTTPGVGSYTLPGHVGAVRFVWDVARWRTLPWLPDTMAQSMDGRPNGRPTGVVRAGHALVFYPRPDASYVVGVQAKITSAPLEQGADEPLLDATWHDGILRRARYEWWDHYVPDPAKARNALASWGEWISTKPAMPLEEVVNQFAGVEVPELARGLVRPKPSARFFSNNWGSEFYGE